MTAVDSPGEKDTEPYTVRRFRGSEEDVELVVQSIVNNVLLTNKYIFVMSDESDPENRIVTYNADGHNSDIREVDFNDGNADRFERVMNGDRRVSIGTSINNPIRLIINYVFITPNTIYQIKFHFSWNQQLNILWGFSNN